MRMIWRNRTSVLIVLAAMLVVSCSISAPAIAQQNEAAVLDARVRELYQAGKFSEAIPLAQRALNIWEEASFMSL